MHGYQNLAAVLIGALSLAILIIWPIDSSKDSPVPCGRHCGGGPCGLDLKVNFIGDLYTISSSLPVFHMPHITFGSVQ